MCSQNGSKVVDLNQVEEYTIQLTELSSKEQCSPLDQLIQDVWQEKMTFFCYIYIEMYLIILT